MIEHPILFSTKMVRAILHGKKTQTRRIINPQPCAGIRVSVFATSGIEDYHGREIKSPYGSIGDHLWVRETFAKYPDGYVYKADYLNNGASGIVNLKTGEDYPLVWKPSIHMPRMASRLILEITDLKIELLREISENDAIAEGTTPSIVGDDLDHLKYRAGFQTLWDSINAERGYAWDTNPFVWVVSFRPIAVVSHRTNGATLWKTL